MQTAILIMLIMAVILSGSAAVLYLIFRRVDPKNRDKSEDPKTAQEFLPFEDIRNNMIVLGHHRYRAILSCSATNYQLKTAGEREQIELSFQRFLNSVTFPITFFLQTQVIDNTVRQEALKADINRTLTVFPGIEGYAKQYQKDMAHLFDRIGNNQRKRRYIIVTYDDAANLEALSEEEKVVHAQRELQHRCETLINGLQAVGVKAEMMNTEALIELLYSCYHRNDYSYAGAIAAGDPFSLFVNGKEDKFAQMPKVELLDLILGEAINEISLSGAGDDPGGQRVLEELKTLRNDYAGYFSEFSANADRRD